MRKVFVDAHLFDEGFQGSRTFLRGLYREILKINSPNFEFYFGANNVENIKREFHPFTNFKTVKYAFGNRYLRLFFNIPWIFFKHKIQISHFQYISPPFRFTKEIVTTHDVLFIEFPKLFPSKYKLLRTLAFKYSATRADLLTTDSRFSKNSIQKHFNIPEHKVVNTLCGVSEDFVTKAQETDLSDIRTKYNLGKFILYVSRVEPRKNHVLLVEAYHALKLSSSGFSLVLIGKKDLNYPELDDCLELLDSGEREKVYFIEASQNELYSFYKQCSLFVYPSLAEGFGLPPLEAVLCGATTLCSNLTSMEEFTFLGDKQFSPHNSGELSDKMRKFILNPKDEVRIEKERKHILEKYNWSNIAINFIEEMKKIPE
jgi:glycosyltransferase involved in cell wall biosynthesis